VSVLINFARFYATTKHAGQLYAGSLPYTHHLAAVEGQVRRWFPLYNDDRRYVYRTLEDVIAAAWLHDVREDCGVKDKEVRELFGHVVADLVEAVTNEDGENRRIRHALTYPKIRKDELAVFLKLCDRLANLEQGGSLLDMYLKEHEDFRRALYVPGLFDPMWEVIEEILAKVILDRAAV